MTQSVYRFSVLVNKRRWPRSLLSGKEDEALLAMRSRCSVFEHRDRFALTLRNGSVPPRENSDVTVGGEHALQRLVEGTRVASDVMLHCHVGVSQSPKRRRYFPTVTLEIDNCR